MRVPFSFRNGSGSLELAGREPGRVTGQSAPSSSAAAMVMSSAAAALEVLVSSVAAPVIVSAATDSATSIDRIWGRPNLMVTRDLLFGCGGVSHDHARVIAKV